MNEEKGEIRYESLVILGGGYGGMSSCQFIT
jgi:hypothetical protein